MPELGQLLAKRKKKEVGSGGGSGHHPSVACLIRCSPTKGYMMNSNTGYELGRSLFSEARR